MSRNLAENLKKEDKSCSLFIERCEEFAKNPPADGWDGAFEMKVK